MLRFINKNPFVYIAQKWCWAIYHSFILYIQYPTSLLTNYCFLFSSFKIFYKFQNPTKTCLFITQFQTMHCDYFNTYKIYKLIFGNAILTRKIFSYDMIIKMVEVSINHYSTMQTIKSDKKKTAYFTANWLLEHFALDKNIARLCAY